MLQIPIRKFNIDDLSKNKLILVIGKRPVGKNVLISDISNKFNSSDICSLKVIKNSTLINIKRESI